MRIHSIILGAVASVLVAVSSSFAAKPEPVRRDAPIYPQACMNAEREAGKEESVLVQYRVARTGRTQDIRVVYSTDACFNEATETAVRQWSFREHESSKTNLPQFETEITFRMDEGTQLADSDAEPLYRVPPKFPNACARNDGIWSVVFEFDVDENGDTQNIKVLSSDSRCFERSVVNSVKKWKYTPKLVQGKPVYRTGLVAQISFEIGNGGSSLNERSQVVRRKLRIRFSKVEKSLKKNNAEEALVLLSEIEAEYGDGFNGAEAAQFHRLRGASRIKTGDYVGALDDLKIAKASGKFQSAGQELAETIMLLEKAVAEQQAAQEQSSAPTDEE